MEVLDKQESFILSGNRTYFCVWTQIVQVIAVALYQSQWISVHGSCIYTTPVPITILLLTLLVIHYSCPFYDLCRVPKYLVHSGTQVVISTENSCLCIAFNSKIVCLWLWRNDIRNKSKKFHILHSVHYHSIITMQTNVCTRLYSNYNNIIKHKLLHVLGLIVLHQGAHNCIKQLFNSIVSFV
jgi:ABC-type transport system involved in cytochrome c biogenesis permease subunit